MGAREIVLNVLEDSARKLAGSLGDRQKIAFNPMAHGVIEQTRRELSVALAKRALGQLNPPESHIGLAQIERSETRSAKLVTGEDVTFAAHEHNEIRTLQQPAVSVFLAVKNGEQKVLSSLLGLKRELDALREAGFDIEINICINNSRDATVQHILRFLRLFPDLRCNLYEVEKETLREGGQVFAFNLLYTLLAERQNVSERGSLYIHMADDDIGYPAKTGGIISNIGELRRHRDAKAVSGTYSMSKHTDGFQFINAVRKDPRILGNIAPLPQGYGGVLTIDSADYPPLGLPPDTAFDVYITIKLLKDRLDRGEDIDALLADPNALPIRTNPGFLVEHPEESGFGRAMWRLLRDTEWRERVAVELHDPAIEQIFLALRRRYYDAITKAVHKLPDTDPRRIAHMWWREIRDEVYAVRSRMGIARKDIAEVAAEDSATKGDQEFCRALIDVPAFAEMIELLRMNGFLSAEMQTEIGKPEITDKMRLKEIEGCVIENFATIREADFLGNPALRIFCDIVERTQRRREMLTSPNTVRAVFAKAGIALGSDLQIKHREGLGNANTSFTVKSGDSKYFVRYHDPLGFKFFQRHAPRKAVFMSVLAERMVAALLGEQKIIGTFYPDIETAALKNFSPQEVNDIEMIAQSIFIQPDISDDYAELKNHEKLGLNRAEAAAIYGRSLADLHGRSFGIARHFRKGTSCDHAAMRLLAMADDDIRFRSGESYLGWLRGPNWVTKIFRALEGEYHAGNPIYTPVKTALAAIGIDMQAEFDTVCKRSKERFDREGSIGHLDFKPNNLFINKRDRDDYKIYDFDYVTFIDPAYEAGHSLYTVLRFAIQEEKNATLEYLVSLAEAFDGAYISRFSERLREGNFVGEKLTADMEAIKRDAHFFAGMTLLSVFASEYRKHGLTPEQMELVRQITIHLT